MIVGGGSAIWGFVSSNIINVCIVAVAVISFIILALISHLIRFLICDFFCVVDFEDYNYLQEYGENMYDLVDGGQSVASDATVEQGVLEKSNVNVVSEMVDMITVSRAYEANQKLIQTIDSTLEKAVNNVGKV